LLVFLVVIAGCKWTPKPTYPANRIAGDLKAMCAHDYKLSVETRHVGQNLQAYLWRVGVLRNGQLDMQQSAAEALERVLLCATRISLSTDAPLQFLQVKMMDALTGSTVTLWRYVPDIRDSMYSRIAEDEYINRLVIDFDPKVNNPKKEWREIHWDPPITMGEFLAKQVVLRVKRVSSGNLNSANVQAHEDVSSPSTLVVVMDNWDTIEKQGLRQQEKMTDLVEQTAKAVIKGYRYTGFRELVVKDALGVALRSKPL